MFFLQAEDGIRDRTVTGVQTCALPISEPAVSERDTGRARRPPRRDRKRQVPQSPPRLQVGRRVDGAVVAEVDQGEIGSASRRETVLLRSATGPTNIVGCEMSRRCLNGN